MSTVLITGAGKGIGFLLAHRMSRNGWNVISAVHRLSHVQGDLPGTMIEIDVSDNESVKRASQQVQELDVLINNAALIQFERQSSTLSVSIDLVMKSLDVNALGALRMAQSFAPMLMRSKSGRIVNVTSICGQIESIRNMGLIPNPEYGISKAALNMVTGMLASELKEKGIAVFCICPSGVPTIEDAAGEIEWAATALGKEHTGRFFHLRQPAPF